MSLGQRSSTRTTARHRAVRARHQQVSQMEESRLPTFAREPVPLGQIPNLGSRWRVHRSRAATSRKVAKAWGAAVAKRRPRGVQSGPRSRSRRRSGSRVDNVGKDIEERGSQMLKALRISMTRSMMLSCRSQSIWPRNRLEALDSRAIYLEASRSSQCIDVA